MNIFPQLLRINQVSQAMNFLLYPMAARLAAEGDLPKLANKLKIALAGVWAVGIPTAMALWFYADPAIPTLLGDKYAAATPFVIALLPAALLEPMYSTAASILVGLGKPRYAIPWIVVGVVLNATANLVLVSTIHLEAAPWILTASYGILGLILQSHLRKVLRREA